MSQVKEQYNSTFLSTDGMLNVTPQIGDMVRNIYNQNNVGVVIELIDNVQSKVLWNDFSSPWESVVRGPLTRNYTQIAKDILQVQPMPRGAMPFYLDMVEKRMKGENE